MDALEKIKPYQSAITRACQEMNENAKLVSYPHPVFIPNESNRTIAVRLPNVRGIMPVPAYSMKRDIKARLNLQIKKQKMLDLEVESRERKQLFGKLF